MRMVRSGQFDVAGVSLNWRLDGEGGEPLVCIHGVGSYLEAWNGVAERLRDRFAVLTFDLRGHGRSCRVKGRYEIDDFVAETLALAEHVGFTTFHLAGFSLGGLIAQRLALLAFRQTQDENRKHHRVVRAEQPLKSDQQADGDEI